MLLVADTKERLDVFLANQLSDLSRTRLAKVIAEGKVLVDGESEKASFKLLPGMEIELEIPEAVAPHDLTPADIPLDVVYEDDDLLVVNKPRHLATHPASTLREPSLVNALLFRGQSLSAGTASYRPGIVHRLDKETTGLLVVAKTEASHRHLSDQIAAKTAVRTYVANVWETPVNPVFKIDAAIARNVNDRLRMAVDSAGKPALTHVRYLAKTKLGSRLGLSLETGRTHQIRVHLAAVGNPVLGDKLYAPKFLHDLPLQLHAAVLAFEHPRTGEKLTFFVQPPEDFEGYESVEQGELMLVGRTP